MTRLIRVFPVILTLLAAVLACNLPVKKRISDRDATVTAAIQTVQVELTGSAVAATLGSGTTTVTLTSTPTQTNTPIFPADTPVPPTALTRCNWASFVTDVTVQDGTKMAPGTPFTKTWRLKNIGTCTWTTDYAVAFDSGAAMGGPSSVPMPGVVRPGETVDVSVNLTAPTTPGRQTGYWRLRNPAGILFGMGSNGLGTFYVEIEVTGTTVTPTVTLTSLPGSQGTVYDFVSSYCSAEWRSAAGLLTCPGTEADQKGFVVKVDAPRLMTGETKNLPGLWTNPQLVQDGVISGKYPAFQVQSGDRFRATLACLYKGLSCDVRFQLNYRADGGDLKNLGQWDVYYEGSPQNLDVDLSTLAGKNVEFALAIIAKGSPNQDWALWWQPRIVR